MPTFIQNSVEQPLFPLGSTSGLSCGAGNVIFLTFYVVSFQTWGLPFLYVVQFGIYGLVSCFYLQLPISQFRRYAYRRLKNRDIDIETIYRQALAAARGAGKKADRRDIAISYQNLLAQRDGQVARHTMLVIRLIWMRVYL